MKMQRRYYTGSEHTNTNLDDHELRFQFKLVIQQK